MKNAARLPPSSGGDEWDGNGEDFFCLFVCLWWAWAD
jgi:hypothetical protein